jgi:hypothetical protein
MAFPPGHRVMHRALLLMLTGWDGAWAGAPLATATGTGPR